MRPYKLIAADDRDHRAQQNKRPVISWDDGAREAPASRAMALH
jgi:hypothetical protein